MEAQKHRKVTLVTQKSIGQDTAYIELYHPLTFEYLTKNKAYFEQRKSSIYRDKPPFSIFGVGDYSFAPYKIAISGLYKTTHFTLVLPDNEKPVMLDDTCYFIGFQELNQAKIVHHLLNSDAVQNFLKAITFLDAKRPMNKDILMRIDLKKVYQQTDYQSLIKPQFELKDWLGFETSFSDTKTKTQLALF